MSSQRLPDPEELLELAKSAPSRLSQTKIAERYEDSIRALRHLGYSDRHIADWFQQQGLPVTDHKVVFNHRKKHNIP